MNTIAKKQFCILLYGNIEVWIDEDKWEAIDTLIDNPAIQMIAISGRKGRINKSHIVGTFSAEEMEESRRRKNGQWTCKSSKWHDRGEKCNCPSIESQEREKRRTEAIRACGKCIGGYIHNGNTVRQCECISAI